MLQDLLFYQLKNFVLHFELYQTKKQKHQKNIIRVETNSMDVVNKETEAEWYTQRGKKVYQEAHITPLEFK